MRLSLIAAMDENGVIGRGGSLPWRLSADLQRFKALTMGHHIIMGRKTFDSIGRILPGRVSIVVSRNSALEHEKWPKTPALHFSNTLAEAVAIAQSDEETFVIGGGEIYAAALPLASRLYITHVAARNSGDTFFQASIGMIGS